jgi:colanic acid/amylovoran biosynthesis protein
MKKILIPNATGPKNIGDQAILQPTLEIINKNFKNAKIKIHTSDPSMYPDGFGYKLNHHVMDWFLFENTNILRRILRSLQIIIGLGSLKFNIPSLLLEKELKTIVQDYKNADIIIFVGGGALRTQKGIMQVFHILSLLTIYLYANSTTSKKIIMPISFGPFGYRWQAALCARFIKNYEIVSVRENYSFNLLREHKVTNLIRSKDFGLLLNRKKTQNSNKNFTVGFTIRNWLKPYNQKRFELNYAKALGKFSTTIKAQVQPIVQVNAPGIKIEDDNKSTKSVASILKKSGIKVLAIKKIPTLSKAKQVYGSIDFLLGMRMHSNIIAATQGTPFVSIAYEYKSEGISQDLGVSNYCIDINNLTEDKLYELLIEGYKNRVYLSNTINKSIDKIKKEEYMRWSQIFLNFQI